METTTDPAQVILDEITALEVERARVEAKISSRMLEFADLRRVEASRHDDPRLRTIETSFAADELAATLHQPTKIVQDRLAQTRRVRSLLPQTWLAHLAGRIDAYRVSLIAAAADKVKGDNHNLIHLDAIIANYAETHTTSQLKGKLKRFVATWSPDGAATTAEKAKRGVWLSHQDNGMTHLTAYIPTTDALRIEAELNALAKAASDERTFDQRKADAFVAQMRGVVDGQLISSRAVIGIMVPCTSLAGLSDEPGESFDGSFALPAQMVRDLAAEPGTLFHRVLTDPRGRILDVTELGRFPSAKLRIAVEIRDGTCRFPTCNVPVINCDIDHQIPHPRGPTAGNNLRGLCRRHHNIKTNQVAEPTDYVMQPRRGSPREHDLATYAVAVGWAA